MQRSRKASRKARGRESRWPGMASSAKMQPSSNMDDEYGFLNQLLRRARIPQSVDADLVREDAAIEDVCSSQKWSSEGGYLNQWMQLWRGRML